MRLVLLLLASLAFSVGGLYMKLSAGLTRPVPAVGVFLLFGLGAAFQARAMVQAEMGPSYVMVLGFEAILVSLLSTLILHERMNGPRAFAVVVILSGIALLQRT